MRAMDPRRNVGKQRKHRERKGNGRMGDRGRSVEINGMENDQRMEGEHTRRERGARRVLDRLHQAGGYKCLEKVHGLWRESTLRHGAERHDGQTSRNVSTADINKMHRSRTQPSAEATRQHRGNSEEKGKQKSQADAQ